MTPAKSNAYGIEEMMLTMISDVFIGLMVFIA